MTFDTFESLKIGDKVRCLGLKRIRTITQILYKPDKKRVVYVLLNPIAFERGLEAQKEFGIFAAGSLGHRSHYVNWERVS